MDEADFIDKDIFEKVLFPMLAVIGKKCLVTSTPKGKNYFFDLYQKGKDADPAKHFSVKFTSHDNPLISKDNIENLRTTMNAKIYS